MKSESCKSFVDNNSSFSNLNNDFMDVIIGRCWTSEQLKVSFNWKGNNSEVPTVERCLMTDHIIGYARWTVEDILRISIILRFGNAEFIRKSDFERLLLQQTNFIGVTYFTLKFLLTYLQFRLQNISFSCTFVFKNYSQIFFCV